MPETIDLSDPPPPKHRVLQVIAGWTLVVLVITFILRAQLGLAVEAALVSSIVNYYTMGLVVWPIWRIGARLSTTTATPLRVVSSMSGSASPRCRCGPPCRWQSRG